MVKIKNGSPVHAPPENTEPLLADNEPEVKITLNGATIEESTDQPEMSYAVDTPGTTYVVEVKNGSFSWDLDGKSNTLSQLNLKIPKG